MIAFRRAASAFRVCGRRILVLNSSQTSLWNPNSITPHSLPNSRQTTFIPCSLKTQNDDGFHGFGSSFRGFCGSLNPPISEEDDDDDCLDDESDEEEDAKDFVSPNKTALWKIVFNTQDYDVWAALDKWLEDGNAIIQEEYERTMRGLFNRNLFKLATNVSSWLWTKKPYQFNEDYYATHLECISKSGNATVAQKYFEEIPSDMKGIKVYRALLKTYVARRNVKKAEFCFERMKEFGSKLLIADYNTMLLAYCLSERNKIHNFLVSMRSSSVRTNANTYRNLIYALGLDNDIDGMEKVIKEMTAKGLEPNAAILAFLSKHYIKFSMDRKAEKTISALEKLSGKERNILHRRRFIRRKLLSLYGLLKKESDVQRHWKEIESDVFIPSKDYTAGILAWGNVGNIAKAEKIFETMLNSGQRECTPQYNALLQVYAENILQSKAEDLFEQMSMRNEKLYRLSRHALIGLFLSLGDLIKAESMLDYQGGKSRRPAYSSCFLILREYAQKEEIRNAERVFYRMRGAGYTHRYGMYVPLLHAYIREHTPAQGQTQKLKSEKKKKPLWAHFQYKR